MAKVLKSVILVTVAAAAAATFGSGAAQARETSKCSATLIHDWYVDGRVDNTYPVHCYQEAIKSIPEDQLIYGTLRDDLTRALQSVIRKNDGNVDPNLPVPPGGGPGNGGGSKGGGGGVFHWLAKTLGPDTASSVPIPLLVLGGLALALMAAAAISFFARRHQARRAAEPPPA
jgi:hypothetical protein